MFKFKKYFGESLFGEVEILNKKYVGINFKNNILELRLGNFTDAGWYFDTENLMVFLQILTGYSFYEDDGEIVIDTLNNLINVEKVSNKKVLKNMLDDNFFYWLIGGNKFYYEFNDNYNELFYSLMEMEKEENENINEEVENKMYDYYLNNTKCLNDISLFIEDNYKFDVENIIEGAENFEDIFNGIKLLKEDVIYSIYEYMQEDSYDAFINAISNI